MKKRKKRIIRSVILIEVFAISIIIISLVLIRGISFYNINIKDSFARNNNSPVSFANGAAVTEQDQSTNTGSGDAQADTMENPAAASDGMTDTVTKEDNSDISAAADKTDTSKEASAKEDTKSKDVNDTITISAAGDVTLGRDLVYGYEKSFDWEFQQQNKDYGYFFRNVKDIFEKDDLTIVNLETTLTTATKKAEKKFRFKADPSYVQILKEGNIEAVNIANNHTLDYLEKGRKDTIATLKKAKIGYFGYGYQYVKEIRGIKVGILGYECWEISEKQKKTIAQAITNLRKDGADIVIVMFHWGIEREYYPYSVQEEMAHYVIDKGADLVLGGHPHVLQGIEEYNGKKIVYSLGNFCFGGNKNPSDKDSMIYVCKFNFKNGKLISQDGKIIACSISSVKDRNNYQPTPLTGTEKKRVLNKIKKYSKF